MVKLIIDYANKNKIILKINEKENRFGCFPLLMAIEKKNTKIIDLIMEYAGKNSLINDPFLKFLYIHNKEMIYLYDLFFSNFNNKELMDLFNAKDNFINNVNNYSGNENMLFNNNNNT